MEFNQTACETDAPCKSYSSYILYDFMQVAGGAERVTLQIAQQLPILRPVVSRVFADATPLIAHYRINVQMLADKNTRYLGRILEAIWCFCIRGHIFNKANVIVYSGFYAPLAVYHQHRGLKIYYCHTIPRFAYDLYHQEKARFPWYLRGMYALGMVTFRCLYKRAIGQMDVLLVNSENVRRRIERYLGMKAEVLYPPVPIQNFDWLGEDNYYLSAARLTTNKRVEVAIQAFAAMPQRRLVVMSGGPELDRLKQLAINAPNIEFVGWQTEAEMRKWIGYCKALVYLPIDEDFGMSPVEAMAAGKPVLGVAEGGLLETIVHGQTGLLIEGSLTPEKLINAVETLETMDANLLRISCEARAKLFDESVFFGRLSEILRQSPSKINSKQQ